MINSSPVGNLHKQIPNLRFSGNILSLKHGSLIKASVLDLGERGNITLRLIVDTPGEVFKGGIIRGTTQIPLAIGQNVYLQVIGHRDKIQLRYAGSAETLPDNSMEAAQNNIATKLSQLLRSSIDEPDFQHFIKLIGSMPRQLNAVFPEMTDIVERFNIDAGQLNGDTLRLIIENSGVTLETLLRYVGFSIPGSTQHKKFASQLKGDLKAFMLKVKEMLKHQDILRKYGITRDKLVEISDVAEKIIKYIEYFQITSKLNDAFYTFIPLVWDGFKYGEFIFKKNKGGSDSMFTCDLNLNFATLGIVSASIAVLEKIYYITFFVDKVQTKQLLEAHRHKLAERIGLHGIMAGEIKVMNFTRHKGAGIQNSRFKEVDLVI